MAWYRTGTVALTNGNATVTGTGTAFIANASIGEAFLGPDGRAYEITNIASDTSLTISPAYLGSTASGQSYSILPARGRIADLIAETQSLLASFSTVRDGIGAGLFPNGSAATPAFRFTNDQDTGIYLAGNNSLGIVTGGVGRVFVDANGRVGVGTNSPAKNIEVVGSDPNIRIQQLISNATLFGIEIGGGGEVDASFKSALTTGEVQISAGRNSSWGGFLTFRTDTVERMRITAAGNVGIGTIAPGTKLEVRAGHADTILQLHSAIGSGNDSYMRLLCSLPGVSFGGGALVHNINGLGQVVVNSSFGSGGIHFGDDGSIQFWSGAVANIAAPRLTLAADGSSFRPNADNVTAIGGGAVRYTTVFATTGTINTSDERDKHWRGELNAAELRAAKRIIGELGIYQWNDAVTEKGEDGARLHFGVRAQRAFAIMEEEGLDWSRYAWCCYDQWEEGAEVVLDEDGAPTDQIRVIREAGDRYGVRPDQLAFWLIAAQAAIQADLEARIVALEGA